MPKKIEYVAKCGLPITIIQNNEFTSIYAGIGSKFGGANQHYIIDNEIKSILPGTAHFLEHKKFAKPDGSDSMELFSKYGNANAYTSYDKTVYYFENVIDYKESLKELLEMYFTPFFTKENVNKEKNIIINEYRDSYDDVYYRIDNDLKNMLYPLSDYSKPLLGRIKDIKAITPLDLNEAYSVFYTPKNSHLVISGNVDDDIINYIEDILKGLVFSNIEVKKLNYISSKNVLKPRVKYYDIYNDNVYILFRMDDLNCKNPISLDKIGAILDSLLLENCEFYNELYQLGLVDNSIDYYIDCHSYSTYIEIEAVTSKPYKLAKKIIEKLKNLNKNDISIKLVNQYIKYKKSSYIKNQDSMYKIGKSYLADALEGNDTDQLFKEVMSLDYDKVLEIIPSLNNAMATYLVAKAKK